MSNKIVTCKECKYYMNASVCPMVYETRAVVDEHSMVCGAAILI